MGNRGTTSSEFPDWYITFQTDALSQLPRPGEISKDIALEWHGSRERMKEVLREALISPIKVAAEKLLKFVGTITIPATEKFVATDHFTVNPSATAEARIGYLSDNFKKWFFGKTEEPNSQTELRYATLKKDSLDKPILDELGTAAEVTLSVIWELLKLQPNGEKGVLLTNGCANIFYVRDAGGELRAVRMRWVADDGFWHVNAYSVECPSGWSAGYLVFSRNS